MEDDETSFDFGEEDDGAIVAAKGKELERAWATTTQEVQKQMQLLANYGTMADAAMVPRSNALLQDHMAKLRTLIVRYEMVAQQYPSEEGVQAAMRTVQEWKDQLQALRMSSRNANLQAKKNIDQAVVSEREQLLSGGKQDVDLRRRQLQTQAGMASAAESITDGLRRTRQMMIQEVERNAATLSVLDQSNATLRNADAEYKGQRSILSVTRSKITSLTRQDLMDRVLVIFFVFIFLSVCFYISLRRLPVVKHFFRGSPVLPVHQPPPPKMPPPPPSSSFSQAGDHLHEPGSQFGVHQPDLPHFAEQQSVPRFSEQGAPESLFYTDGRAHDPRYVHEEL
jgi:protein transport protein SEC20